MSEKADQQRTRLQRWAAPGGSHDFVLRAMKVILPSIIGGLLALLVFSPFNNKRELSFVLDKGKVDKAEERMRVADALYKGEDNQGRPFFLRAGSAVQKSAAVPTLQMNDLVGQISTKDGDASIKAGESIYDLTAETVRVPGSLAFDSGSGYQLTANNAFLSLNTRKLKSDEISGVLPLDGANASVKASNSQFDYDSQVIDVPGAMAFDSGKGYNLVVSNARVWLKERRLQSTGPVTGSTNIGTFRADTLSADMNSRIVILKGRAQLRIDQNVIR
jgi:lipopolysaccharide export system protein LptC